MTDAKAWTIGMVCAFVTLIVIMITCAVSDTIIITQAFESGYCEVTLPGRTGKAWQKCD